MVNSEILISLQRIDSKINYTIVYNSGLKYKFSSYASQCFLMNRIILSHNIFILLLNIRFVLLCFRKNCFLIKGIYISKHDFRMLEARQKQPFPHVASTRTANQNYTSASDYFLSLHLESHAILTCLSRYFD